MARWDWDDVDLARSITDSQSLIGRAVASVSKGGSATGVYGPTLGIYYQNPNYDDLVMQVDPVTDPAEFSIKAQWDADLPIGGLANAGGDEVLFTDGTFGYEDDWLSIAANSDGTQGSRFRVKKDGWYVVTYTGGFSAAGSPKPTFRTMTSIQLRSVSDEYDGRFAVTGSLVYFFGQEVWVRLQGRANAGDPGVEATAFASLQLTPLFLSA